MKIKKDSEKPNSVKNKVMAITFLILIGTPFLIWPILKNTMGKIDYGKRNATYTYFYNGEYVDTAEGAPENLAEYPRLSLKEYRRFSGDFENWLNDNLPFKKILIKLSSEIKYNVFRQFDNSHVVVGKDGWLFYDEAVDESIGKWTLTEDEAKLISDKMQETSDILASKGIEFVLFIAPNKETVYAEYLPNYDCKRVEKNATEVLVNYLKNNTTVRIVYPLDELVAAKEEHTDIEFYHKLDTHWNCAGAYIGAKALTKELGCELPDFSDVECKEYAFNSSDLTALIGMPVRSGTKDYSITGYGEETTVLDQWEYYDLIRYHNDSEDKKIIVFRDSFSTALSQHLSIRFKESIYPLFDSDKKQIYDSGANIVVYELVERDIKQLYSMGLDN